MKFGRRQQSRRRARLFWDGHDPEARGAVIAVLNNLGPRGRIVQVEEAGGIGFMTIEER